MGEDSYGGGGNAFGYASLYAQRLSYSDGEGYDGGQSVGIYPTENEWSHIAIWTDASQGLSFVEGETNGILKIWHNNKLIVDVSDSGWENYAAFLASPTAAEFLGGFTTIYTLGIESDASGPGHENETNLWGDIYADNTLSRIAIGDAPVWSQVSHYEMQIPSAWTANSINFVTNVGSFSGGSVYLFVIDAEGNASNGYQINL